jgi:hypothetical protein
LALSAERGREREAPVTFYAGIGGLDVISIWKKWDTEGVGDMRSLST